MDEHKHKKESEGLFWLEKLCEFALKERLSDEATIAHSSQLELLGKVFTKTAEDDTPTEVPDYLCCRITLDIFRDPVITPSGVTYERAVSQ
ncbi:hypothetical protein Vadar_019978 [Vaccinium darrowii]|uniref:Uncharacterized protein n=1 Tax=Vaccinium darrowii TaxID=229202 RepID=A0ACB7Y8G7_9ERIC|nr:hypothetical protein Vadar_019978 [Vaccinium darrowii]